MRKILIIPLVLVLLLSLIMAGCGNQKSDRETLMQVSTIDALMAGLYDGILTLDQIGSHGDFGIGTFDTLDGEMVVLDGEFYKITADGKAYKMNGNITAPFAAVTYFDSDLTLSPLPGTSYSELQSFLDSSLPTKNLFYAFKINGTFSYVKTRSVPAQQKPYVPLVQITAQAPVFELWNTSGTLVGFRCPVFVEGINVPGYHLHFLTDSKDAGGHVLDFTLTDVKAEIDYTPNFSLNLAENSDEFYALDLTDDKSAELEKVEK